MKKGTFYTAPSVTVMTMQTESAFLSSSGEDGKQVGMEDLTYEDIQWN